AGGGVGDALGAACAAGDGQRQHPRGREVAVEEVGGPLPGQHAVSDGAGGLNVVGVGGEGGAAGEVADDAGRGAVGGDAAAVEDVDLEVRRDQVHGGAGGTAVEAEAEHAGLRQGRRPHHAAKSGAETEAGVAAGVA